jgi:hypothetical protein
MEWSEKPTTAFGKAALQVGHAAQRHDLGRRGVEVRAFQQRIIHPGGIEDRDAGADRVDGLHAGRQDHRLALAGDVADQRQVVRLARADLVGGHVQFLGQEIGRARLKRGWRSRSSRGFRWRFSSASSSRDRAQRSITCQIETSALGGKIDFASSVISSSMMWVWCLMHLASRRRQGAPCSWRRQGRRRG